MNLRPSNNRVLDPLERFSEIVFGLIMVLNLMIGLLTPPVGMVLYILARVSNISFERATRACAPFLIPLLGTLLIVTYWPGLVLWLPKLIYP